MPQLAGVYIFDVPYHADRVYTYYVPGEMEFTVQKGDLVEVPFGKGNRRQRIFTAPFQPSLHGSDGVSGTSRQWAYCNRKGGQGE